MTTPHHDDPAPAFAGLPKALKIGIPVVILGIAACLCCLVAAYFLRGPVMDRLRPVGIGEFVMDAPVGDGSTSGAYRLFDSQGGEMVRFDVSSDGVATFRIESAPETETLTAALVDAESASMSWNGQNWTGMARWPLRNRRRWQV